MSKDKIRVGIIGVVPGQSWSAVTHIPALRTLDDYEIVALSTKTIESARAASEIFDIPLAFDNAGELIAHPDVDLVVVTVKVPGHLALVNAAIDAGKAVYSEWPLGKNIDETIEMADRARKAGVRTGVGLQARSSPTVRYVRDLIADGYVGEVLSTTMVGSGGQWGDSTDSNYAYLFDRNYGATMLTIPFGHTVEAVCYCLGEFAELSATTAIRRKSVTVTDTGEKRAVTAADQVAVSGILDSGVVASLHYRGGHNRGTNLLWEINGTQGDLQVIGNTGHGQMAELVLKGARGSDAQLAAMPIPESYGPGSRGLSESRAINVANNYALFAADWRNGTHLCADFDGAVTRHRMLAAIESSAAEGRRVSLG